MRWIIVVVLAMLCSRAAADERSFASFAMGGGAFGGELRDTIHGAGRLRVASGTRERRWATDECLTWDSGVDVAMERHGIVSYSRGLTRYFRLDSLLETYIRSSLGVALLDGELVAPSLGGSTGLQVVANRSSYALAMFIEAGYEATYFMPASIDASFAYITTGFSVGVDF